MRYVILAGLVVALVQPAQLTAQDMLWLRPEAKVRVTAPALGWSERVGRVQELHGDTLVVLVDAMHKGSLRLETTDVPLSSIAKLEVSTGRRSHWLEGAGIGALLGLVVGVASGDDPSDQWFAYDAGEKAAMGALGFGLIGAGIGALVKSDKWAEVPLDELRPRLIARERGLGIGLSLEF